MKSNEVYLQHILEAISKIEKYVDGIDKDGFFKSELIQDAVLRELEIIGEAANRIEERIQKTNAFVPWAEIIGMRNKLIHDYFRVDLDIVWITVKEDLPHLKEKLKGLKF